MRLQPTCREYECALDLAHELFARGCAEGTAMWLAIKYDACGAKPTTSLMAEACHVTEDELIKMERRDLKMLDYIIVKL